MVLSVLICTLNDGVKNIIDVLLPEREDVNYVVSFQYTDDAFLSLIPEDLKARKDVSISCLQGKGLSRNRNNAFSCATGDLFLIADDDARYKNEYFDIILKTFQDNQDVDIALFKAKDYEGKWLKEYPGYAYKYGESHNANYPCSCEMVIRKDVYVVKGVCFDELFGLGSDYLSSGEEDVFLKDALRTGVNIVYFPELIVETDSNTTGLRILHDEKVQRSKGAALCYCYGFYPALFRCIKESLYHFFHSFANPFVLLKNMCDGIKYCRKTHERI